MMDGVPRMCLQQFRELCRRVNSSKIFSYPVFTNEKMLMVSIPTTFINSAGGEGERSTGTQRNLCIKILPLTGK